jgi:hypothetical protein
MSPAIKWGVGGEGEPSWGWLATAVLISLAAGFGCFALFGVFDKETPNQDPTVTHLVLPDSVLAALLASDCEITYGPYPTPREGWEAWGVICPEGVEPR